MTEEEQGTIAAALELEAGPQRLLRVHDTTFEIANVDLDAPGALAEVHRLLAVDEPRNTQIAGDVTAALARGLTRRVAHVEALTVMLAAPGHKALVLQGSMSTTDRRAAVDRLADAKTGDGVLVIGTTPFIGEGFDAPALDTLFLAGPISYDGLLIQCAGRVIRTAPGKTSQELRRNSKPSHVRAAASRGLGGESTAAEPFTAAEQRARRAVVVPRAVAAFGWLRAVLFKAFAVAAASAPFEDLAGPGHRRAPLAVELVG